MQVFQTLIRWTSWWWEGQAASVRLCEGHEPLDLGLQTLSTWRKPRAQEVPVSSNQRSNSAFCQASLWGCFQLPKIAHQAPQRVGHASKISRTTLTRYCVFQLNLSNPLTPFDPASKLDAQEPAVMEAGKESQGPLGNSRFPVSRLCALYETAYRLVCRKGGTYQDLLIILQLGC